MSVRAWWLAALAELAVGSASASPPSPVTVEAPARSRLAAELRRELEASGFVVMEAADRTISVSAREDRVVVFSNDDGRAERLALTVDPNDRLARRRAALAVVEFLRLDAAIDVPAPPTASPVPMVVERLVATAVVPARGWALGAATTVNFDSAVGEPTGHLQLIWLFALGPRLSAGVKAFWPLLGAQLDTQGLYVRMWTFAGAAGLQYALTGPQFALRPYLGATVGARGTLTDTNWLESRRSRVALTPSATAAVQGGIRYRVLPLAQLFLELEAAHDWRLGVEGMSFEEAAANATSAHASLGVLFEY